MADAGTVAVLLPGAFYFLREKQLPPIQLLRDYQVPIAIATDCNPGTSPTDSHFIDAEYGLCVISFNTEEAMRGITCNAAKALGIKDRGFLAAGNYADFVVWDIEHPRQLACDMGGNAPLKIMRNGKDALSAINLAAE